MALKAEVAACRSATAVVRIVRRSLQGSWDLRWGAEALHGIVERSTAKTRQQWARDPAVVLLSDRAKRDVERVVTEMTYVEAVILALEALRRLELQRSESQRPVLKLLVAHLSAGDVFRQLPVILLARLLWLSAPLRLEGVKRAFQQLRERHLEVDGKGVVLVIIAMQAWACTTLLRVPRRLQQSSAVVTGLSIEDEYELSMDLTPHGKSQCGDWHNILRFTEAGEDGDKPLDLCQGCTSCPNLCACWPSQGILRRWQKNMQRSRNYRRKRGRGLCCGWRTELADSTSTGRRQLRSFQFPPLSTAQDYV